MTKKFIANFAAVIVVFAVTFMGFSASASADDSAILPSYSSKEVTINCHGTGMVLDGANVRSSPTTNSPKISYIPAGKFLTGTLVTGDYVQDPNGGRSNKWLPVVNGGYVSVTTMSFTCDW